MQIFLSISNCQMIGNDERNLRIDVKELEEQMKVLGDAIQDSEVLIKMLE